MLVPLQFQFIGMTLNEWLMLFIAAFAGGAFGAALGALPAFIFTGFMVIAGEAVNTLASDLGGLEAEIGTGITGFVAFGPVFGPHVSFAGGAAAAAYAARKGYMDTGFDFHEAKNIAHALGTKPDVLAVGGLFGILGMLVRQISGGLLSLPWDPIAMGVVLSAVFHRLVLGYPLVGDARGKSLLDMSPFEREEMVQTTGGGEAVADGGTATVAQRLAVEPWLPHQYKWPNVAMIGAVTGILAAYTTLQTGSIFLGFGISAASLVFLNCGVDQIPVTHHMTLPGATAAVAFAGGVGAMQPLPTVLVGALFGLTGALTGEVVQRVFYSHSDTHFDPPAAAIVVNTFAIAVLALAGVFPSSAWVPVPI
jgi:MFS family permease